MDSDLQGNMKNVSANTNDADAIARDGVFSSPELIVETKNIPAPTVAPDRWQFASSATGNIKIKKVKRRHGFRKIGFIVGAIIILGLLIGIMLHMVTNKDASLTSKQTDVLATFEDFANYLLYGTEDGEFPDAPYDYGTEYAITEKFANRDLEYFEELNNKFNKFVKAYDRVKGELTTEGLEEFNEEYGDAFRMLYGIIKADKIDDDLLLEKFLKSGKDSTLEYVRNNFNKIAKISEDGQDYMDLQVSYAESFLGLLEELQRAGCIVDAQIAYECAVGLEDISYYNDKSTIAFELGQTDRYLGYFLYSRAWDVYESIKEGQEAQKTILETEDDIEDEEDI